MNNNVKRQTGEHQNYITQYDTMNRTKQMTTAQTIKRKVQRRLRAVLRNVYTLTFSQHFVKTVKIGKMVLSRINNIGGTRALLLRVCV